MNTEPNIVNLENPTVQTDKLPDAIPQFEHAGNGKIARLPKATRDQINNWLRDGLSSPEIIKRLGDAGNGLNPGHFHEYRKRGYQDWLRQREWLEHLTSKAEFSADILSTEASGGLHEAGLRLAAAQMFDQFMRFSSAPDAQNAQPEIDKLSRLSNALSRLSREALAFQKYRDTTAKATAQLQKLDEDRDLNDNESLLLVNRMDRLFRRKVSKSSFSPERSEVPTPNRESSNESPAAPESFAASPQLEALRISQSKLENQKSKIGHESLINEPPMAPESSPAALQPEAAPISQSKIKNQKSKIPSESLINEVSAGTKPPVAATAATAPEPAIPSSTSAPPTPSAAPEPPTVPESLILSGTNPPIHQSTNPGSGDLGSAGVSPAAELGPVTLLATSKHREGGCPPPITTDHQRLTTDQSEHCLECLALLPPLRPDGGRPSYFCTECSAPLPPGGDCRLPSIEQCPETDCRANLPRVRPNGERPTDRCLRCGNTLPPPAIAGDDHAHAA